MTSVVYHPPAVYVVRWGDLWKAGWTTRRRWMTFQARGAELVDVTFYPHGDDAGAAELLVDRWLHHIGHQAFARKADAAPFLGSQGAGWMECHCLCSVERLPHPIAPPIARGSVQRLA